MFFQKRTQTFVKNDHFLEKIDICGHIKTRRDKKRQDKTRQDKPNPEMGARASIAEPYVRGMRQLYLTR